MNSNQTHSVKVSKRDYLILEEIRVYMLKKGILLNKKMLIGHVLQKYKDFLIAKQNIDEQN